MNSEEGLLCLKVQRKILLDGTVTHMPSRRIFHQKGLFLAVQGIAWNSSDCFESFSPLNNVVPEGVITTWSNRMIFRLFKGHWMPLFEICLSINVIMCKSAMHCQSSNKSRLWPLFDEEWASSYSHHFTHRLRTGTFSFKKTKHKNSKWYSEKLE